MKARRRIDAVLVGWLRLFAPARQAAMPAGFLQDSGTATAASRPARVENVDAMMFPPILLLANAVISLGFATLALQRFSPPLVLAWVGCALFASVLPLTLCGLRARVVRFSPVTCLRLHEVCTVILGLVWASFPALFFDAASTELRIVAVAITFAISGIGSLALARVQSSAILFCALIAGSLTLASFKIGGDIGLALGVFSLFYSMSVALMIVRANAVAQQRADAVGEVKKQNEIISLLLNDFDKGALNWLWETDGDGRLTYVSQRFCDGIGRPAAACLGLPLAEAACADTSDAGWFRFLQAIDSRCPVDGCRLPIDFGSSRTWWRITAKPLLDETGAFAGYRGAAHDITGDHEAEAELIVAKEAAEKASATKSQFLAVMSHELRTPLNAIVGFAELLASSQSDDLPDERRADHLKTIIDSSRHLQLLINDILDATRIEKGTLQLAEQEADAAELVEVAVKMCRDTAEKADITIIARIVEGIEIKGDITRIKQVLINLITNAVKFSPPGGFVHVGFERSEGGGLSIAVRDDGVGIRKEDIERIFDPFVQADAGTSRRFGGIGLGLSIARKIANLHGGNVVIESEHGVGTTARLLLPGYRITRLRDRAPSAASAA